MGAIAVRQHLWRALVDRLPAGRRYPVLGGPLRGRSWWLSHHGYYEPWNPAREGAGLRDYGYLSGRYERENVRAFCAIVRPGDVVYDVGAHHGYYAAIALRLGAPMVYAFEPDEGAWRSIRENAPSAILCRGRFQDLVSWPGYPPDVVKIDVDGDDLAVLAALYAHYPRPRAVLVFH